MQRQVQIALPFEQLAPKRDDSYNARLNEAAQVALAQLRTHFKGGFSYFETRNGEGVLRGYWTCRCRRRGKSWLVRYQDRSYLVLADVSGRVADADLDRLLQRLSTKLRRTYAEYRVWQKAIYMSVQHGRLPATKY